MTDESGLLAAGMRAAATLGLPLHVNGQAVPVPQELLPALPEAPEADSASASIDFASMHRDERIEAGRRVAFAMAVAGQQIGQMLDALALAPANANKPDEAPATIDAEPPPITKPAASVAWATTSDRLASAPDVVLLGSNAALVGGSIIIERSGDTFSVRRRFADRTDGIDATSESGALSIARRMATDTSDNGDTR